MNSVTIAKPSRQQLEWQDMEVGLFIHFNIETYAPEWENPQSFENLPDPDIFNPVKLNTDQWMQAAKAIGAKYAVLTTKHSTGFCLWPTGQYEYSVKRSKWRNGKGDVVAEFVDSCRRHGIKPGFYCSYWTNAFMNVRGGRVASGKREEQERYNRVFLGMLRELCSNYGELVELWFDGGIPEWGPDIGPILHKLQPNAMVFQGGKYSTIRWVGNEEGVAPYPFWNTVPKDQFLLFAQGLISNAWTDGIGEVYLPGECDTTIRGHYWFWRPSTENTVKPLDELMAIYYKSVGRGCNLLLNSNPDRDGLIPEADMKRYLEFGKEVKRRFSKPIAEGKYCNDDPTRIATVELIFEKLVKIDTFVTMEDLRNGQRIREYVIEAYLDGSYVEVVRGSSIGHKKIDKVNPITTDRVRIRILKAFTTPVEIRSFSVYCCSYS